MTEGSEVLTQCSPFLLCRAPTGAGGEVGIHGWGTLEQPYTGAELGMNVTAVQGLNIHSKSRKVRQLQARKVFIYSGSLQWDGHGEVVPEGQ